MIITVNEDTCIGCGLCVNMAPTLFEMKNAKAVGIEDNVSADLEELAREAQDSCPVAAIIIS